MDQRFTLIPALTNQNEDATIFVRATRIWDSINRLTKQVLHANVVLLDQEENQVLAVVRNNQRARCFPLMSEGMVYQISNTKIVSASKAFRPVDRSIALLITTGTRIETAVDTGVIPRHKFELSPLEDIGGLVNASQKLIDVIGLVIDYGDLEQLGNGTEKIDIMLANEREKAVMVTLWDDKARQFLAALESSPAGPVFVVLCGLLPRQNAGNAALSSTVATRTYLNIDYKPLQDLRSTVTGAFVNQVEDLPPPSCPHSAPQHTNNLQRLTIQELLNYNLPAGNKLARCLCHAEIVAFMDGGAWIHNCCPACGHKTQVSGGEHYCYICAEGVPELKKRIIVRVRDVSAMTTFTLFKEDVEELLQLPPGSADADSAQAKSTSDELPELFKVLGKKCVFNVRISPYNANLGFEDYAITELAECVPRTY